jgi:hypothetical protein
MLILLDCRPLQKAGPSSEVTWFIITCAKELAARHGAEWIFLLDGRARRLDLPANGRQLIRKTLRGRLGDAWWDNWLLPGLAARSKADMVMTTGEERKKASAGRHRRNAVSVCIWNFVENELVLSLDSTELRVPLAPDEKFRWLSGGEREKLKEKITGGREFFFANISGVGSSKVTNLLKAFSLFKKRQLSNMKLVLAGAGTIDKLDSYKYRDDICVFPEVMASQMEAAYAVIHLRRRNDPGISILNAWKAKTPVIVLGNGGGTAGDAVLQVPEGDVTGVADALKSLYKNEGIRNELIERGASKVAPLSVVGSAAVIGKLLETV